MHMDKTLSDIAIDLHQINAAYVALASVMFDCFLASFFIAFIAVYRHLYRRTFNVGPLRRQLIREQNIGYGSRSGFILMNMKSLIYK